MSIVSHFYQGAPVRTVEIDGEPWFVLADLCKVLDIANPRNVTARIDPAATNTVRLTDGNRGNPNVTVVDESGMYEVIFRSDKAEAVDFRRWVTGTVLPSIRKTGGYGEVAPQGEQLLALAVLEANRMIEQKDARIAELEPRAEYVEQYVADEDLRLFRNVAKSLGVQEKELRERLIEQGWIYTEKASRWSNSKQQKEVTTRYSAYAHKTHLFTPVPNHEAPRFKGEVMHTLKVTPDGATAIAKLYGQRHLEAVV